MNDALTNEIRRALAELVDAAPLPPEVPGLTRHPLRHLTDRAALVSVLVVALAVAGAAVARDDRASTTVAVGPPGRTSEPEAALIAPPVTLNPTLVSPSRPPDGLRFIEGGSRESAAHGVGQTILLVGPDGRVARLGWNAITVRGGCAASGPATTARGAPDGAAAPTTSLPSSPGEATFKPSRDADWLQWCDDALQITLTTTGFDEASARILAGTVRRVPGQVDELTLTPPEGFLAGRPSADGPVYVLAFRPEQAVASRPQLIVRVVGAWTTDLRLLQAENGSPVTPVEVSGRPGFAGALPGGPRYQSLTVLFDDSTLVTLLGDGLSAEQLVATAGTLLPADPALAPSVIGDAGRCDRLGMCG